MRNPMWTHWVARSCTPHEPFRDFESARWFWGKLSELFPEVISAVLMPNHFHLILPAANAVKTGKILRGLLGAMSVKTSHKRLWQPMSDPFEIPDLSHLRR